MPTSHIGRAWSGCEIEQECPCPQAACGLVIDTQALPGCRHHYLPKWTPTIRQAHDADKCEGAHRPERPARTAPPRLRASAQLRS